MPLLRTTREVGEEVFIGELLPCAIAVPNTDDVGGRHRRRELLGMRPGQPLDAEVIEEIAPDLTYRGAADLRWALDVLRER